MAVAHRVTLSTSRGRPASRPELVDRIAPDHAVGVGQVLVKERRLAGQPGREQPAQGRVELDGASRPAGRA